MFNKIKSTTNLIRSISGYVLDLFLNVIFLQAFETSSGSKIIITSIEDRFEQYAAKFEAKIRIKLALKFSDID